MLRILIVAVFLTTVCVPGKCAVNQGTDTCIEATFEHQLSRLKDQIASLDQIHRQEILQLSEKRVQVLKSNFTKENLQMNELDQRLNQTIAAVLDNSNQVIAIQKTIQEMAARQNRINVENIRKVAVTSCLQSKKQYAGQDIFKFLDVKMSSGVSNITAFKSTGKFTCEYPGLYHVTVTMAIQYNDELHAYIMKNKMTTVGLLDQRSNGVHSITGVATLILDTNDTVYIQSFSKAVNLYATWSCMSITKIK